MRSQRRCPHERELVGGHRRRAQQLLLFPRLSRHTGIWGVMLGAEERAAQPGCGVMGGTGVGKVAAEAEAEADDDPGGALAVQPGGGVLGGAGAGKVAAEAEAEAHCDPSGALGGAGCGKVAAEENASGTTPSIK